MATGKKRIALFLFTMALTAALIVMLAFCGLNVFSSEKAIQPFVTTAEAATLTTSGKWQSNGQTVNFTPEIVAGDTWDTLMAKGWGKDSGTPALEVYETEYGYGIRPKNTGLSADIGNDDFTGGIYYTIKLSEADLVKAAAGQLSISASAQYYRQATASVDLSLRAEFHRLDGSDISTAIVTSEDGGGSPKKLTLTATSVPVETAYIEMWFSNSKSLSARPWIADMQAYLHDATAPSAVSSALIENSAVTARGGVIAGDTVEYSVTFNEKISVDNPGTAKISVAGTEVGFSSYSLTETAGISTVKYSFGIPKAANNGTISFSGVSGSVVKDEAGNTATVAYTGSPGTLNYYAEADITVNCSDMTYTGDATASLGTDASIVFMPDEGYSLPSAVTVTIGGIQIPNSYKYYADTGRVTVYGAYIKSDIAVAADGVANTYTVTYDSNKPAGASGTVIGATADSAHTYDTAKVLTANGYTLTGWTFKGWSKTASGGKAYDNSQIVENLTATDGGTVTLYAVWEANTYTVTYNSNKPIGASATIDGTTADSTHTYDTEKALTANGYTLTGWTFKGWSKTASGGKEFDNSQSVGNLTATNGGTVTLYAVWEANTYTVTYNSNKPIGASGIVEGTTNNSSHTYDTEKQLTANEYTLTGWTFKGWSKTASGGKEFDNSQSVENLTATNGGTVTLYAVWEANTYTVTYNSNKPIGASATIDGTTADSTHTYDTEKALTANGYTLTGWTFKGWSKTASGGKAYDNSQIVENLTATDGGTVTLYAVWEANTYTVTYNSNKPIGASGTIDGTTAGSAHTYDTEKQLTANGYTLTGWTFLGWARTDSGEKAYDNEQSVENLTATDEGNVNLYAVWTANEYTLYFNAAGGTGSGSNSVYYDGDLPILANVPDRNGYNFSGYFDAKDGEGTCYYGADGTATEGLKYTVLGSLTLYAEWEPITYTVMLYSEGNYIDFIECTFGSITFPSAAELGLERANYDFVGWNIYDEQNWSMYSADREYNVGLTGEQGAEVTVYAAWQERPVYTLGFDANGGTGAPTMTSVHVDETITLSAQKPVRENYTFVGWAHEADSGVPAYTAQGEFTMGDKATTLYAVWKKNPMLSYDANGGEFYSNINVSYPESGETVTLTEIIPHRTGYDFIGWATEESAAEPDCDKTILMPDRDTVLYAVWEKQRFAITVSVPSGYTVEGVDGEVEYGTEISFTVTGENAIVYVDGIKLESSDGVYSYVVTCQTEIKVSDGTEFYLLYAANGGVGAPIDENGYVSGNTATVAAADEIRRTGYTFKGWALESNAVEATVSEGDSVSFTDSTVTLFAVWEPNVYYVRYYSENSLCDTVGEFRYDEIRALDGDLFEKTGHTFVGWATVDGGTAVYSDRAEICNLTTVNGETIYLYAVWKQTVTTVTFDQSGGTEGSLGMAIAYGTQPETDTVLPPVKKGYVFLGYFTAPEGGVQVFDSEMNLVNSMADYSARQVGNATNEWQLNEENITLYAVYAGVSYTVVYVNGTAEAGRQAAVYGEPFALSSATSMGIIPPENYTFAGWSAVPDGMVAYADMQQITNGLAETEGAEFYLYAVFEENEKIHVYYDANGGMNAPVDNTAYYVNTEISLMTEVPEKEGYIFKGWGYDNKAVTFEYNGGTFTPATFSATADVRLYAVWEAGETLQAQIDGINATAEDIYAAIAALESADTDVSGQITALTDRIAAAEATVNGLDETFITDAELSAAVAALETAYSAADTALQNAIEEIRTDLAEAVANIAENTTYITSLNGELAKIKEAYAAADALIASDVAALEIADGELAEKITALETAYLAADTALQSAIEAVQTSLDNAVKDFNENLTAEVGTLNDKITALDTAYRAADTLIKSDIAALGTADGELAEKITALETEYKAADIKLQGAIDTVQGNLDTAVEELQNAITANEADIEEKVSELDAAYAAADALIKSNIAALGTADGELAEKITALETAYEAADTALQGAIDTVQGNLDTAVEDLQNAITANEADIEEKVSELDAAYAAADALIKSDITALGTADGELAEKITALETAYKAADTALQGAIDTVQGNLDTAVEELQNAITANEADIEEKVSELDAAYAAADALIKSDIAALGTADGALRAEIAALETAYLAADTAIENMIDDLSDELDAKAAELQQAILSNESDIEGKVKALDEAYKLADALIDSELYSLQSADENLSASIAALDTAYKAADEVLKNAIKQLQNALDELRLEMEQNADGTEQAMTATSEKAEKTEKTTKIYLAITIVLAVCAIALSAVLITKMYLGKSKKDVKTVNADNAVKADKTVKKAKKADVKHMKYRRKKN